MIIPYDVDMMKLFRMKLDYPWSRPLRCPHCNSTRLWGHGFVSRYFDGFNDPLVLKRYRCRDCHTVLQFRPKGYFRRFQASIETIEKCIQSFLQHKKYLPGISRQRQRHWIRGLQMKAAAYAKRSGNWLLDTFRNLITKGIVPISRGFQSGKGCG